MAQAISRHRACVAATHVNPEGDAIGSLLALTLGLEQLGMQVWPTLAEPLPPNYAFLPGADRLSTTLPDPLPALAIVLDCDGPSRLGPLEAPLLRAPELLDIDHHSTGKVFGARHWLDAEAAATGEMVEVLLRELGVRLTPEIALNLYAAILTDTGRFSFANTTSRSLESAARMVAAGAQPVVIYRNLYESKPAASLHLLGEALVTLRTEGRLAWAALSQEAFLRSGAERAETEGIIDSIRAVRGVELGMLCTQQPDGSVRASLRSRGRVDVARLALQFGGGGHPRAAGCTLPGPLPQAVDRLVAAARQALEQADRDALAGD